MADVTAKTYACIAADPPWPHRGGGGKGAQEHYDTLSIDQIIRVMLTAPCWQPADNAHLWLWVPNNWLEQGLHVMRALGFRYVTNLAWAKDKMGIGFYLRGKHELCLFGVRGSLSSQSKGTSSLVVARRLQHSRKPDEAYDAIEAVSPGPRLEMFARRERDGWDLWGNQAPAPALVAAQ